MSVCFVAFNATLLSQPIWGVMLFLCLRLGNMVLSKSFVDQLKITSATGCSLNIKSNPVDRGIFDTKKNNKVLGPLLSTIQLDKGV